MIAEYQKLLEEAFPVSKDVGVYRAISEGVLLADGLISDTPLLNTVVGKDMRGLIRRAGIMWRLHDLSRSGDVEYEAVMAPMLRGRWHCVELRSGVFKVHICRTDEAGAFPEESMTRFTERSVNPQMELFDDPRVLQLRRAAEVDDLYAYLTYSVSQRSEIAHFCWSMESRDGGDWVAHIDALTRVKSYQESQEKSAAEQPTKATKVKFHDFIQEAISQKGLNDNTA